MGRIVRKPNKVACGLRIKCHVLESCCSFDGSFLSQSTNVQVAKANILCRGTNQNLGTIF